MKPRKMRGNSQLHRVPGCWALGACFLVSACGGAGLENTGAPGGSAALAAPGDPSAADGDAPSENVGDQGASALADLSCVLVRAEARYAGFGYNHIVYLNNTCGDSVSCEVSTDVQPSPVQVSLESGQSTEVLTFRGSPAAVFHAKVSCDKG